MTAFTSRYNRCLAEYELQLCNLYAASFQRLHGELTARYPCICTLDGDRVDDDRVWSDRPLCNDFGRRVAVLGVMYSRVEEVMPFVIETATSLGLTVFDWAGPTIYRPAIAT